ncbi:MAG: dihydroorotate dehydrogenase electron transfer subunit [Planctomycetia bacterium]|nr:dihydroorotate dehydrogenase electron transfer subunit [Planctomycetia bacterium]
MKIYHGTVTISATLSIAKKTWIMRLKAPEVAKLAKAGQFVMLRIPGCRAPLLGRPLAIYAVEGECVDIVYAVVGHGTELLSRQERGMKLEIWGPLGNGFPEGEEGEEPILVAGGIGQTPMRMLAIRFLERSPEQKVTLLMGHRSEEWMACEEDFKQLSEDYGNRLKMELATEDGSLGHRGLVTDLLAGCLRATSHVYACGPFPMLRRVAEMTAERQVPCHVSLETPMACGMGICFGCVTKQKAATPEGWDYCRTCTEGPVFDASQLVWD